MLKKVAPKYRIPVIKALLILLQEPGSSSAQRVLSVLVELGAIEALPTLREKAERLGRMAAVRAGLPSAIADLESRAFLPRPASPAEALDQSLGIVSPPLWREEEGAWRPRS